MAKTAAEIEAHNQRLATTAYAEGAEAAKRIAGYDANPHTSPIGSRSWLRGYDDNSPGGFAYEMASMLFA